MLFNIYVNQFAYSKLNIHVSLEAACLLNMMQQKMALKEFQKETIKENDKLYFWFTHSLVRKELPMLFKGDESAEAISKKVRRIAKELEDTGLIECHKSAKSLKKSMYCFTDLSDLVIQTKAIETDKFVRGELYQSKENNTIIESPTTYIPNSPKVEFAETKNEISETPQNTPPLTPLEAEEKKEKKVPPKKEKKVDEVKAAKEAEKAKQDIKFRSHLHQEFIEIYDKWHAGLKGERIPDVFWKQHVRAMASIREKFIPLSEQKLPSIGMEATDANITKGFSTFLDNLKKSLTQHETAKMTPRFLENNLLEFLEKVRNNYASNNGRKSINNSQQQLVNKYFTGAGKATV